MHSMGLRIIKQNPIRAAAKFCTSDYVRLSLSRQPKFWKLCQKANNPTILTKRFCSSTVTQAQIQENEEAEENEEFPDESVGGTRKIIYYTPTEIYEDKALLELITGGEKEAEKTLRILCLEHEVMRQAGNDVPESLSIENWKNLLQMTSRHKRSKFYRFLFIKSCIKAKEKEKRLKKAEDYRNYIEQRRGLPDEGHIKYGLSGNTFLLRIYESTITEYHNYRLIRCMEMQEQKLFIDCGFEQSMTQLEISSFSKQLILAFRDNRIHDRPFDLHFCNAKRNDKTIQTVERSVPTLYDKEYPLNVIEGSYSDVVPKKNIVYLTPHCREVLEEFDHDACYIIGGIVDKTNQEPLTLAKAKKEGLRMAKLPLDQYLNWGQSGSKSLTINQMVNILLDLRMTGDWNHALRHVPKRKLNSDEAFLRPTSRFTRRKNPFDNWDNRDRKGFVHSRY